MRVSALRVRLARSTGGSERMNLLDTWTRATRRTAVRWFCGSCGAINPDITGTCIRCGK